VSTPLGEGRVGPYNVQEGAKRGELTNFDGEERKRVQPGRKSFCKKYDWKQLYRGLVTVGRGRKKASEDRARKGGVGKECLNKLKDSAKEKDYTLVLKGVGV